MSGIVIDAGNIAVNKTNQTPALVVLTFSEQKHTRSKKKMYITWRSVLQTKIKHGRGIENAGVGNCDCKSSGQESLSEEIVGYLGHECPRQREELVQWPCQGGQRAWTE